MKCKIIACHIDHIVTYIYIYPQSIFDKTKGTSYMLDGKLWEVSHCLLLSRLHISSSGKVRKLMKSLHYSASVLAGIP